jgi:hypothetical protein
MGASRTIGGGFLLAVMVAGAPASSETVASVAGGPEAGAAGAAAVGPEWGGGAGASVLGEVDGARASSALLQNDDPFGFEVGEARHYVLGPEEALAPGERAVWITTLERVEGAAGSRHFVFRLQHRREAPRTLRNPPVPGEVVNAQVDAELTVNEQGAPLSLQYVSQRHIYDVGDEVFQVTYRHDGDRYNKEVALQGWSWDYDVEMIEQPDLDPRRPAGLFAFAPAALRCMEWEVGARMERRIGSGDTSPNTPTAGGADAGAAGAPGAGGNPAAGGGRGGGGEPAAGGNPAAGGEPAAGEQPAVPDTTTPLGFCNELNTDPAFANPGLLGLAMPTLWDRRGDGELVLFAPLRPDLVRGEANRIPITFAPIIPIIPNTPGSRFLGNILPGLSFESLFGGGRVAGDKERARDPRRYFFVRHLTLSERQRIEVGPRSMEALPLAIDVPIPAGTAVWTPAADRTAAPPPADRAAAATPAADRTAASTPPAGFTRAWIDDWGKVLRIDLEPAPGGPARFIRLLHPSEY